MDSVIDDYLAPARVGEIAMEVFAAIAIVIAIMGLYAIVSFSVDSRTHEFGVRLALGATGRSLFTLVIRDGLGLAAAGLLLGLAGAVGITRMMQWRLFQVGPGDAITLAAVVGGVFIVGLAAALVPARRALAVDPMTSVRTQ